MNQNFSPSRLVIARKRRRMSSKALAESIGVSPVTISRLEQGANAPDPETLNNVAGVLGFPVAFFLGDEVDELTTEAASFRSLTAMSAKERDAALAAGAVAFLLADWVSGRFNLPAPDVPDLSEFGQPAAAARLVRQHWGLGEQPIASMIKLLEAKGVRVFSLAENTKNVDAFSSWRDGTPYVFLNSFKSTEHSRFDAAHELGHLVLHKHGGPQGRGAETEANAFASAFLMPESDVRARASMGWQLHHLIAAKKRWGVSVAALAYRIHKLGFLSDWQYRTFCIQMNNLGYRTQEPEGLPREESVIWRKVLTELWSERISKSHIAAQLSVPADEIENLVFGLTGQQDAKSINAEPGLRLVP